MRTVLIVVTTIAIGGLASLSLANAAPNYVPGGAVQQAGMCQVSTDGGEGFYGYMTTCPEAAKAPRTRKKREH